MTAPLSVDDPSLHRRYVAIAMVSAAVMLYEIGITRVLSVTLWYHFAFLAASLAMLGLGVPGVWYARRGIGPRSLERSLVASVIALPATTVVLLQVGGPLDLRAALTTILVAVSMLALGSAVCVLLLEARGTAIARMYGFDLLGAAVAAASIVPMMRLIPTPAIVAGAALLPAAALIIVGHRRVGGIALLSVAAILAWGRPLELRYTKEYAESGKGLAYEKWTPTARLAVYSSLFWAKDPQSAFGWGMGSAFTPRPIDQMWLEQDGSAGTPITKWSGAPSDVAHLQFDVTSVGYQVRPAKSACVIGAGGGRDIVTALLNGTTDVDAVEINPFTIDIVSTRFRDYSGDPYHAPGVRAHASEGRNFLTTTDRRYDVIQIALVDSWAATAAGAFSLSENYLYTLDSYRLYWSRLSPTGMISTSRWMLDRDWSQTVRLARLVQTAIAREGIARPWEHVAVVRANGVATLLASPVPFTDATFDSLRAVSERRGFELRWPTRRSGESDGIVASLVGGNVARRTAGLDLTPPVDDRPFFFHTLPVFGSASAATGDMVNDRAVRVLRALMIAVTLSALALFFAPFMLRGFPRGDHFWRGSGYFALIGLGFMLVEIPTIQRMILYLGNPSHATTVVLASMLLGGGLGSMASSRISASGIPTWAAVAVALLAACNLAAGALASTIGAAWPARALVAAVYAAVMGFVMGVALPLGMRVFGDRAKAWFWAVNGACGVAASVSSLAIAMTFGFTATMWAGVACYLVAVALIVPIRTRIPIG